MGHLLRFRRVQPAAHVRTAAAVLVWAALAGAGQAATAQQAPATVAGTVRNRETSSPVEGVRIQVLGTSLITTTDSAGRFFIPQVPPGVRVLQARAIGYAVASWLVHLDEGRTITHALELEPRVYELPGVTAVGNRGETWRSEAGFLARRDRGIGFFITREDIAQRNARTLTELMRNVPGVMTTCNYFRCTIQMSRSSRFRNCSPEYFLDGFPASFATGPDFPLNQIRGVEVYRSETEVPSEFHTPNQFCGVIAIWSVEPGEPLGRPATRDTQPDQARP